jgi:hypothetical protein
VFAHRFATLAYLVPFHTTTNFKNTNPIVSMRIYIIPRFASQDISIPLPLLFMSKRFHVLFWQSNFRA